MFAIYVCMCVSVRAFDKQLFMNCCSRAKRRISASSSQPVAFYNCSKQLSMFQQISNVTIGFIISIFSEAVTCFKMFQYVIERLNASLDVSNIL